MAPALPDTKDLAVDTADEVACPDVFRTAVPFLTAKASAAVLGGAPCPVFLLLSQLDLVLGVLIAQLCLALCSL